MYKCSTVIMNGLIRTYFSDAGEWSREPNPWTNGTAVAIKMRNARLVTAQVHPWGLIYYKYDNIEENKRRKKEKNRRN